MSTQTRYWYHSGRVLIPPSSVAYNRVALTDYFQHRNIEKLYLESRTSSALPLPPLFRLTYL